MKIIDAIWEQRNIGVKTYEIIFEEKDNIYDFEEVEKNILEKDAEYIVVKTPVNNREIMWELPKLGYTFIEMGLSIALSKDKYVVPSFVLRLDRGIRVDEVKENNEVEKVLEKFKENIFDTDRITIDPYFENGISATRYQLWTMDMLNSGCVLYEVLIKDKKIGFFIVKKIDDKTAYPVLAGLYSEYKGKGLGALLIKKLIDKVWEMGYEKIITSLVSNNIEIIKIDLGFGFKIENFSYVYVKHCKENKI